MLLKQLARSILEASAFHPRVKQPSHLPSLTHRTAVKLYQMFTQRSKSLRLKQIIEEFVQGRPSGTRAPLQEQRPRHRSTKTAATASITQLNQSSKTTGSPSYECGRWLCAETQRWKPNIRSGSASLFRVSTRFICA